MFMFLWSLFKKFVFIYFIIIIIFFLGGVKKNPDFQLKTEKSHPWNHAQTCTKGLTPKMMEIVDAHGSEVRSVLGKECILRYIYPNQIVR